VNAHLRRTFYLLAMGFVALVGVLAYWQVYMRESLVNNPANALQSQRARETPRGLILAGDGETVLARSERVGEESYRRVYPEGEVFANVVGYWSSRFGANGIEIGQNNNLSSTDEPETLDELINQVTGGREAGNNVTLTLDPELQRLAHEKLANSNTGRGSVVALNPQTGEILAMATYPSFDPNNIDEDLPELSEDPDAPLVNRATQSLYPPGSTFKVITSAAALRAGVTPEDKFDDDGTYETPGYTVHNYMGRDYGELTFAEALVFSVNTIFSKIAVERIGPERLAEQAFEFGFGDAYEDFPLPVAPSSLGLAPEEWAKGNTAPISFGQDRVLTNVFEMALVAGAVGNGGDLMEPRIVREVRSPDGIILDRPTASVRNEAVPPDTAATLNDMMQRVIEDGELVGAQIEGIEVAGKTGTAENAAGEPHSWFVSYAPADDPEIAVAVMIENGGIIREDGSAETPAITIAGNLMRAYLDRPAPTPEPEQPPRAPGVPGDLPGEAPVQPPAQPPAQQQPFQGAPFQNPAQQQQQFGQPPAQAPAQPPAQQAPNQYPGG